MNIGIDILCIFLTSLNRFLATSPDTILAIAIGNPAVANAYIGLYKLYAELKYPIPSPPSILARGILKNAPIIFTITIQIVIISAPLANDWLTLLFSLSLISMTLTT